MKTLKTAILIVLMLAIGVCGYLVYQEVTETKVPDEQTEQPQVTRLNDSTYHINLSDCSCVTLEKIGDTLFVESCGVNFIHANRANDSIKDAIRVGTLQTYVINYNDFFDSIKEIKVNLPE